VLGDAYLVGRDERISGFEYESNGIVSFRYLAEGAEPDLGEHCFAITLENAAGVKSELSAPA